MKFKRHLLSLIIGLFVLTGFAPLIVKPVNAQDNLPEGRVNQGLIDATMVGIYTMFAGGCNPEAGSERDVNASGYQHISAPNPEFCNPENISSVYRYKSPIGSVLNLNAQMFENPPTSGIVWARHEIDKIQGKNVSYAQSADDTSFYRPGTGFTLLAPMQGFWSWARNLAYVMFIVVVIAIAFMILFRQQIGGQTPITIFNSIPSIIIALVLITFSYPISGLFVDTITLGTNLMQTLLISGPGAPARSYWDSDWKPVSLQIYDNNGDTVDKNDLQPDDVSLSIWNAFSSSGATVCSNDADSCDLENLLPKDLGAANAFGSMAEQLIAGIEKSGLDGMLIKIIMAFTGFMVSIRLFMTLLSKYLTLILAPIIAPLYFFVGGFPSKSQSMIGMFFRVHLAAALVFVSVYGWFLLMIVIAKTINFNAAGWAPPLLGYSEDVVFSSNSGAIANLLTFALYLGTPAIPKFIDSLLDVPDTNMLAQEIGSRIRQGTGFVGRTVQSGVAAANPRIGGGIQQALGGGQG